MVNVGRLGVPPFDNGDVLTLLDVNAMLAHDRKRVLAALGQN